MINFTIFFTIFFSVFINFLYECLFLLKSCTYLFLENCRWPNQIHAKKTLWKIIFIFPLELTNFCNNFVLVFLFSLFLLLLFRSEIVAKHSNFFYLKISFPESFSFFFFLKLVDLIELKRPPGFSSFYFCSHVWDFL